MADTPKSKTPRTKEEAKEILSAANEFLNSLPIAAITQRKPSDVTTPHKSSAATNSTTTASPTPLQLQPPTLTQQDIPPTGTDTTAARAVPRPALLRCIFSLVLFELNLDSNHSHQPMSTQEPTFYDFLRVPFYFEKFMSLGLCMCLEAFLHTTFLMPVRAIIAVVRTLIGIFWARARLNDTAILDVVNVFLWCICVGVYSQVDTSVVYHNIRNQALLKLYAVFNMLDVCDRLCTAIGQEIITSLYVSACTTCNRGTVGLRRALCDTVIAVVFMLLHTGVKLMQVTTLHVAVNTSDTGLLVILITTNFVEIKSSVFKKSNPNLLFKLSCTDVTERFQLVLFLAVILWENANLTTESATMAQRWFHIVNWVSWVLAAEILVDWVKHAFIVKSNNIPPKIYTDFKASLCQQIVSARKLQSPQMHSTTDVASIALGFPSIPFSALIVRILLPFLLRIELTQTFALMAAMIWGCLVVSKITFGIGMLGYAFKFDSTHPHPRLFP